ncbi:MAG: WD40/YVTN/BNR-like repeat-containing protein [Capsulimonadaceae bacterium]
MTKPTILVSTWGDGLFAVTGDGRTQEMANQPVRGLAPDGRGGALAIVGRHSLRRRASSGEWATVATSEFELSCCMSVRDIIYVGTDDARMLRLSPGSSVLDPITGFDTVPGRDTWYAGSAMVNGQRLGPPLGIRSVAASSNASVLFANVHVGGIPRSMDGGRSWQPTIDIHSDVHEVRAHQTDPNLVVAASAIGLCISRDAGATWAIERDGLHASHCYAIALSGDDIIVSASTDFFAADGRIYRRPVKPDGSLAAVEGATPAWIEGFVDTGCIAANGSSIAVADRSGNLYGSDDFGQSWSCRSTGLPVPSGVLIC